MATNATKTWLALLLTALLASCGGGDNDAPEPAPEPVPAPAPEPAPAPQPQKLHFELHSGRTKADFENCLSSDVGVPLAEASYAHLMYMQTANVEESVSSASGSDAAKIHVLDTAARCTNLSLVDANGTHTPHAVPHSRVLHLSDAKVNDTSSMIGIARAEQLGWRATSFVYDDGGLVFAGYAGVKAGTEWLFYVDEEAAQAISTQAGGWLNAAPALYDLPHAYWGVVTDYLVAGMRGRAPSKVDAEPVLVDGSGLDALLYAPHHLVRSSNGTHYFIDGRRVRTAEYDRTTSRHYEDMVDSLFARDWKVTTLSLAMPTGFCVNKPFYALAADMQGNIHALQLCDSDATSFVWHRLADSTQLPFDTYNGEVHGTFGLGVPFAASFAIIDGDMLLAVRSWGTELYRVSGTTGYVTKLTGDTPSDDAADFLAEPGKYMLPPVQHVHYGADGHLYLLLEQGILVSRNFAWPDDAPQ